MTLITTLHGTPVRIWFLLAGLVALGLSQARPHTLGAARAAALPAAPFVQSLAGVASSFGLGAATLAAWLAGAGLAFSLVPRWLPRAEGRWSDALDRVHVAGSWLPLALIVGLFTIKYVAGTSLALHPQAASDAVFAVPFCFAYGLFAGAFAVRGRQLWQLRRRELRA